MSTKLHPIVLEFFSFKSKRLRSLKFVKVEVHQDDIKSFKQLLFLEQINLKCDVKVKELILNTPEDEVIPFPLRDIILAARHPGLHIYDLIKINFFHVMSLRHTH